MSEIDIYKMTEEIGRYIVEYNTTIRLAARNFNVSKSTVYKDITELLEKTNPFLSQDVRKVLDKNKEERNERGGETTRQKYLKMRMK